MRGKDEHRKGKTNGPDKSYLECKFVQIVFCNNLKPLAVDVEQDNCEVYYFNAFQNNIL